MDMRSWKKTLLQWITKCGFTERNYFNIEQSDIEGFYRNFRKRHPKTNVRNASSPGAHNSMIAFLKEYYPDFHPNLDDEGSLSASDYIYVYSLFLHFSCVKYPDPFFHECCQHLSEHYQSAIAGFFKELLELSCIKREFLRHAIAECAAATTPPQQNESMMSSSGSSAASGSGGQRSERSIGVETTPPSPVRTPKRQSGGPPRASASTPKSFMLEERTRELYNLRAQLETERYEKGLLEMQNKQYEDKIVKLNHDHRKLRQHIQDLKNDILSKASESGSPSRDDDEQIKRRLCREISQKEDEISKLTDVLSALKEENHFVEEKLIFAEKQIILCMERIKELDYRVDELTTEMEQKNDTIKYLSANKLELEQFIAETRSASAAARPDLNSTGECLDGSFGPRLNSSSSVSSPENLGCSVVDKQLREQENENLHLREELCSMRASSAQILKQLQKLALRHANDCDLRIENLPAKKEDCVDLADYLTMFTQLMDVLSRNYKEEKCAATKLQEHSCKMQATNTELTRKLNAFEKEIVQLRKNAKLLDDKCAELQKSKQSLQERLTQREEELDALARKKTEVANDFQALTDDYNSKIEMMQRELEVRSAANTQLSAKNAQIEEMLRGVKVEMLALQRKEEEKSFEYANELQGLSDKLAHQNAELEASRAAQHAVKDKYEKLLVSSEALKRDKRATDDHLEAMRNEIARKEMEMSKLGVEIVQVRDKNKELEERINTLMSEYRTEKDIAAVALSKRDQCIREIGSERQKLESQMMQADAQTDTLRGELKKAQEQLKAITVRVKTLGGVVQTPGGDNYNHDLHNGSPMTILDAIIDEVKELAEFRVDAVNRIKNLEFDNIESSAHLHHLEGQQRELHAEKQRLLEEQQRELHAEKQRLLEEQQREQHEEKQRLLEACAKGERSMVQLEELRAELAERESELTQLQTALDKERETREQEVAKSVQVACVEYINALNTLEEELNVEHEVRDAKEEEMEAILREHKATVEKLAVVERQLELMIEQKFEFHSEHDGKFEQLEAKVNRFTVENSALREEVASLKQDHDDRAERLTENEKQLAELTGCLSEEHSSLTALSIKLKESELRLVAIQQENSTTVNDLQATCTRLTKKLQHSEERLKLLECLKTEQLAKIDSLSEQCERISKSAELQQTEQAEKLVLLEQRCVELTAEIAEGSNKCTQLQTELGAKEAELRMAVFEKEQAHEDWQTRLSELMRNAAEQSLQQEMNDNALIEIIAVLENKTNISFDKAATVNDNSNADANIGDVPSASDDFFASIEQPHNKNYNRLRCCLNQVLMYVSQLRQQIADAEERLTQSSAALNSEIDNLQQLLAEKVKALENQLGNEVQRLSENVRSLECVNVRLTADNATMQCKLTSVEEESANVKLGIHLLMEEKTKLGEENAYKAELIDRLKQEEKKLGESNKERQAKIEKLEALIAQQERQLKERAVRQSTSDKELQAAGDRNRALKTKLLMADRKQKVTEQELAETGDKLRNQRNVHDTLEGDVARKNKELVAMQAKLKELSAEYGHAEEQCKTLTKKLDQNITQRLAAEDARDVTLGQLQQLERDYEFSKQQLNKAVDDMCPFLAEIDIIKKENSLLGDELKDLRRELLRANDNISELIQQIASIRLEKEAAIEENALLRNQLEQSGRNQTLSETLERQLLTVENKLKSIRVHLEQSEAAAAKLTDENCRLRGSHETATRRCEQIALQLGETQARCAKQERDNDKLLKAATASAASFKALEREEIALQMETKMLRERVARADRGQNQLIANVQTLEKTMIELVEAKQKLELSEEENKTKLTRLEKIRDANEEKLRKLNNTLHTSEQTNVRLTLEVGALNSELAETQANRKQYETEMQQQLSTAQQEVARCVALNNQLAAESQSLRERETQTSDQLSKVSIALQISQDKCEMLEAEIEMLRADLSSIRDEKRKADLENAAGSAKVEEFQALNEQLLVGKRQAVEELQAKVYKLEAELGAKGDECVILKTELNTLRAQPIKIGQESADATELESMRRRLALAIEVLEREQQTTAQLRLDNQILQAKYRESKLRALDEGKVSEERIKENRLELEGKLEKMKNKMKTLYTEEITKMKAKQERETVTFKTEVDVLKTQNTKYEADNRKLSSQMVRLNDKILELQKHNTFLSTKVKHMSETHDSLSSFKRPSSIHVSSSTSTLSAMLAPPSAPAVANNVGTNLAMEDEEGEVFNNTYLADLKSGHMSDFMNQDICPEELQYRNSLLPPHLKSAYAAQYENDLPEDELKDGPHLDDSMSALLSTTSGGTRKKIGGVTHYKRPGPPTPSKNGGRLSFGGSSEPPREILKESYDGNAGTSASCSAKTPARFGFFASRFSMGNPKDEASHHHYDLHKVMQSKNKCIAHLLQKDSSDNDSADVVCTSTPRQSREHLKRRQLFDQMLECANSAPSSYSGRCCDSPVDHINFNELSLFVTPVTGQRPAQSSHSRSAVQFRSIAEHRRSSALLRCRLSRRLRWAPLMATPSGDDAIAAAFAASAGARGMNTSLHARRRTTRNSKNCESGGQIQRRNTSLKNRLPSNNPSLREMFRRKARKQRTENFNQHRALKSEADNQPVVSSDRSLAARQLYDVNRNELSTLNVAAAAAKEHSANDDNDDSEDAPFERTFEEYSREFDRYLREQMQPAQEPNAAIKLEEMTNIDEKNEHDIAQNECNVQLKAEDEDGPIDANNYKKNDGTNSCQFEQMLADMESHAPFNVNCVQFGTPVGSQSLLSDNIPSTSRLSLAAACSTAICGESVPSALLTPNMNEPTTNSSTHLSRVIYGGSVIYNRRLPSINTYVSKSSIYVNDNDPADNDDVILFADQTVTFVDLVRMWKQMNVVARLIIGFAALAALTSIIGLIIVFCKGR